MARSLEKLVQAAESFQNGRISLPDLVAILRAYLPMEAEEAAAAQSFLKPLGDSGQLTERQLAVLLRLCEWDPTESKPQESATASAVDASESAAGEPGKEGNAEEGSNAAAEEPSDQTVFAPQAADVAPAVGSEQDKVLEHPEAQQDEAGQDQEDEATIFVGPGDDDGTVFTGAGRKAPSPDAPQTSATDPSEEPPPDSPLSNQSQSGPGTDSASGAFGMTTGASRSSSVSSWSSLEYGDDAQPVLDSGSIVAGRFALEDLLGKGGMGIVFKARDLLWEEAQDRNPYVAIKILNEEFKKHPESLKALQREARKSQTLAHPNIVHVYNFDRDHSTVYMTMEFLDGDPLDVAIRKRHEPFPTDEALLYIRQMSEALGYAHRNGIVHSDFKPGNVFLTKDNLIKVLDFGIARATKSPEHADADGETTYFNAGDLGALTPAYASLEMFLGEEPEPNDDIFALGCVAYELLTKNHPYNKRPANKAVLENIEPNPVPQLKRRQAQALRRAIALRREDRTQSIDQFLDELFGVNDERRRYRIAAGVVIATIGLGAGGYGINSYLEGRHIAGLNADLSSMQQDRIANALNQINEMDVQTRGSLLISVRDSLTLHFVNEAKAAFNPDAERFNYVAAEQSLESALKLYPDSNRVMNAKEDTLEQKNRLLNELDAKFTAALASDRLLPDAGPDNMEEILQVVAQTDPTHPMLTDARLSLAYQDAADQATARQNFSKAREILTIGTDRFPQDERLAQELARVQQIEQRVARQQEIESLESEIRGLVRTADNLEALAALQQPVAQLTRLDPRSTAINQVQDKTEQLLVPLVDEHIAQRKWAMAFAALAAPDLVLDATTRAELQATIQGAQDAWQSEIQIELDRIAELVETPTLAQPDNPAVKSLARLRDLAPGDETLEQARKLVAEGYIDLARSHRANANWDAATSTIKLGQQVLPDYEEVRFARELQQITNSKIASNQMAERERIEREKATRLASIGQELETEMASLSAANIGNVVDLIDEYEAIDPGSENAARARTRLVDELVNSAAELRRNTDYAQANSLLSSALRFVPNERPLLDEQRALRQAIDGSRAKQRNTEIATLNAELDNLLAEPVLSTAWENQLADKIRQLQSLDAMNAPQLEQTREQVAQLFINQAAADIGLGQLSSVRDLLRRGSSYAPDLPEWATQRTRLAQAEAQQQQRDLAEQRLARLSGLKRTFSTQIRALDTDRAIATLNEISALDREDEFIDNQAHPSLADAFERRAIDAIDFKNFSGAQEFVDQGLQYQPGSARLTALRDDVQFEQTAQLLREHFQGRSEDTKLAGVLIEQLNASGVSDRQSRMTRLAQAVTEDIRNLSLSKPDQALTLEQTAKRLFANDRTVAQLDLRREMNTRQEDAEQQRIAGILSSARRAEQNGNIIDGRQSAVSLYKSLLNSDTGSSAANTALNKLTQRYIDQANQQINSGQLAEVLTTISILETIGRAPQQVSSLRARRSEVQANQLEMNKRKQFENYIATARERIDKGPTSKESLAEVASQIDSARQLYPRDDALNQVDTLVIQKYQGLASNYADRKLFDEAIDAVEAGLAYESNNDDLLDLRRSIEKMQKQGRKKRRTIGTF